MTRRLTPELAQQWAHALADVNCWFSGFRAALGDRLVDLPPGFDRLLDIKIWMDDAGEKPQPDKLVEAEFPEVEPPPVINPTGEDVVRRFVIDLVRYSDRDHETTGYTVREGDRFADRLEWSEMLGLIATVAKGASGIPLLSLAEHRQRFRPEKKPDDAFTCPKCGTKDAAPCDREDCPIPF